MNSLDSMRFHCQLVTDQAPVKIYLDISTKVPCWLLVNNRWEGTRKIAKLTARLDQSLVFKYSPRPGDTNLTVKSISISNRDPNTIVDITKFETEPFYSTSASNSLGSVSYGLTKIDAIYYINLLSRPVRKQHIVEQLAMIRANDVSIYPIKAVELPSNPQVGCAMSHMKALTHARHQDYETIMILEDDFTFRISRSQFDNKLETLWNRHPDWEVAQLATVNEKSMATRTPGLRRVLKADTTSGYLLRSSAIVPLFNIFLQCCRCSPHQPIMATNQQAIDVAWQAVQAKMNWFLFAPQLGYQSEKFTSDIENYRAVRPFM